MSAIPVASTLAQKLEISAYAQKLPDSSPPRECGGVSYLGPGESTRAANAQVSSNFQDAHAFIARAPNGEPVLGTKRKGSSKNGRGKLKTSRLCKIQKRKRPKYT